MAVKNENYSFLKSWSDMYIDEYDRTSSVMSDFHYHDYYEVSLILSGEVKVLAGEVSSDSNKPRAVLCAPGVPHYITCTEGTRYRRLNVIFSEEFVSASQDFERMKDIFKSGGNVITLDEKTTSALADTVRMMMRETDRFRRRLLLVYYLSLLADADGGFATKELPKYVSEALSLVKSRFSEKIVAMNLAAEVNVGRTTLMNGFKKYTGMTLGEYILKCRLASAIEILGSGASEREVAEQCGFGDSSNLIRSFKRHFGITPKKYLQVMKEGGM